MSIRVNAAGVETTIVDGGVFVRGGADTPWHVRCPQ
jgi:hypothetical protein